MSLNKNQEGKLMRFDIIVIGSGLSGLHYCLKVTDLNPNLSIALITKDELWECNSRYAQGGIAAVFSPEDSFENHITDTLKAGDGLNNPKTVKTIVTEGFKAIQELESHQVAFRKKTDETYQLAQEGGHSARRIFNCGDETGLSIIEQLNRRIKEKTQIHCFDQHIAVNLIASKKSPHTMKPKEIIGVYVLNAHLGTIDTYMAGSIVLATGGAGKIYRYTTNPMIATGDGVALAYRAGARIGNMEFYQFHPTLLHHPSVNNFLISEAVRGEGALLTHPKTGERFLRHYVPEKMELATRDRISRAIFNEIEQSDIDFVHMDIRHKSKSFLKERFSQIYRTLLSLGIDMSQDLIPVVPAAHYQCGGIVTDLFGQTDLKRLYAIGEVAMTGLHGANRLASNSLLEAVVMASRAAQHSVKMLSKSKPINDKIPAWHSSSEENTRRASEINAHWRSLRGEMTSYAGIVRTEAGLNDLLQLIVTRYQIIEKYYWTHCITRDFIELRNIVLNAELIVRAALARRESRGGHYREDYPDKLQRSEPSIQRLNSPGNPFM